MLDTSQLRQRGEKIRLIVSDMDGTLLNSHKQISAYTKRVIQKAREQGIDFTIATGRIPAMTEAYVDMLEITDPVIASNGAVLFEPKTRQTLFAKTLDNDAVLDLLSFAQPHKTDIIILGDVAGWYAENSQRVARFQQYNQIAQKVDHQSMSLRIMEDGHLPKLEGKIYKVLIYEPDAEKMILLEEYLAKHSKEFERTSSEAHLLDISATGVSKATGLQSLLEHKGYKAEEVCVFGDYYNDISMMEVAGLSFAMEDGAEDVKKIATAVTQSSDNDGVAYAIEKYIL